MKPAAPSSLLVPDCTAERSLVQALARSRPQTRAEATFRRLIADIENRREVLQRWQAYLQRYHERLASEWLPLEARMRDIQRQMIMAIDQLLSQAAVGRPPGRQQRARLAQILLGLLDDLIGEDPDDVLIALFEKYNDVSYAEARESELELHQALIEDLLGVDLGPQHRATSAEELLEQARHKLHAEETEKRQRRQARANKPDASGKADAARARKEQAAREVRQSLRDVYRKLVSALHPDRESDAGERQRKTQLIQRVNQAYEANDLLTLLGLQLEIEQIDSDHLANVAPERLAHYNQVLREQLAELDAEIDHHVLPFREIIGGSRRSLDPAFVDHRLSLDIVQLHEAVGQAEADLAAVQDPRQLSALLKRFSQRAREDERDDMELVEFIGMFESDKAARASRKRRR